MPLLVKPIAEAVEESDDSDDEPEVAKGPQVMQSSSTTILTTEDIVEMSEANLRKLRNAYRHPFEYISPLLYSKTQITEDLKATELFVADEDEYMKQKQVETSLN